MPTADQCRAMAAEADRLASLVSYGRDKVRLREQAEDWLRKADELDAKAADLRAAEAANEPSTTPKLVGWLRRRVG